MEKNLDENFIIIKRKAEYSGNYPNVVCITHRETQISDNTDIAQGAEEAGYQTGDTIEYEVRIPKKSH